MTEKRFTVYKSKLTGLFVVNDNTHEFNFEGVESASTIMKLTGLLNKYIDENEQLKKENYELHKRLGDFEPFEKYMKERTSKTSLEDIIGIVKTDEPTNSVELKKELYK